MDESFTVAEFCKAEKISKAFFYKLFERGDAPKSYTVGANRRITREAHAAWRAAREAVSA
jgi:hypothetical protein